MLGICFKIKPFKAQGVTGLEILKHDEIDAYRQFILSHSKGHFMQSPEWGAVKRDWKWEAVVEKDAQGDIIGGLSVLVRKVPGLPFTLLYAPRGPVCDVSDEQTLTRLIAGVRALAVRRHAYLFKMDPDVPCANTEFTKRLEAFGFQLKDGGKNFESIQPRFVFRLNIEGKSEEQVMAGFHSKTRYNIRVA